MDCILITLDVIKSYTCHEVCLLLDRSVSVWFLGVVDVDKYFLKQFFITIISRRFKFSLLEAAAMLKNCLLFSEYHARSKKNRERKRGLGSVAQVHSNIISDEVSHKITKAYWAHFRREKNIFFRELTPNFRE